MLEPSEMILRLVVAALLGSVVGLERERKEWTAGLREHMLVSVGAALFMLVSMYGFSDVSGQSQVHIDPSRVAAQVVSGIGFLGAGTILVRGDFIKGMTTASGLWATAAVGLATGGGLYLAAVVTTVLMVAILAGIKPLSHRFFPERKACEIALHVAPGTIDITALEAVVQAANAELSQIVVRRSDGVALDQIDLVLRRVKDSDVTKIVQGLRAMEGVRSIDHRRL